MKYFICFIVAYIYFAIFWFCRPWRISTNDFIICSEFVTRQNCSETVSAQLQTWTMSVQCALCISLHNTKRVIFVRDPSFRENPFSQSGFFNWVHWLLIAMNKSDFSLPATCIMRTISFHYYFFLLHVILIRTIFWARERFKW